MEDETKKTLTNEPTSKIDEIVVVTTEEVLPSLPIIEAGAPIIQKRKINYTYVAIAVAVLAIIGAYLYTRGYIVAATVNGSPISRLSVIKTLEAENGKQTLEAAINKQLIEEAFEKQNITASAEEVAAEIKIIEESVASQGGTLDQALTSQGMTREILAEQLKTKVRLEKLLADKVQVSPVEVETYMAQNNITVPKGEAADAIQAQITDQIKQQKLQTEAQQWIAGLTATAQIKYYVSY